MAHLRNTRYPEETLKETTKKLSLNICITCMTAALLVFAGPAQSAEQYNGKKSPCDWPSPALRAATWYAATKNL